MYEDIRKEIMVEKHFGCSIDDIAESVIVTPIWKLDLFAEISDTIVKEFKGWYRGITLSYKGHHVTVISSGIGSPMTGDCVLALGYSNCKRLLFSGSAGAINSGYEIGDLLISSEAVIGEGFSRYHKNSLEEECFGHISSGDSILGNALLELTSKIAGEYEINIYKSRIFTIDSILGENTDTFGYMKKKGCDAVEMEVSAVFTACSKVGIRGAALIIISDLPLKYKNLFEGTTHKEIDKMKKIEKIMPEILLEASIIKPDYV